VNAKSDIHKFGMVLLEIVTRNNHNDVDFGGDSNIVRWIHNHIQIDINKVLDSQVEN
jgi:hypothetical protein